MRHLLSILLFALPLAAQKPVIRQDVSPSGTVDFSNAAKTTPLRIGTTLPATCAAGELFFLTDTGVFQCVNGVFVSTGGGGTWGSISGNLSAQSDLADALKALQPLVAIGTQAQYVRGDGSLATFPTSYPVLAHAATHGKLGSDPVAIDWAQIVNAPSVPTTAAALGALGDPGASGLVKRTAASTTTIASAGTDYVIPSGTVANFSGPLAGDVTGTQNSTVVNRINGVAAAASATTDTTNASNIMSGTLAAGRLPATVTQTNQSNTYTGGIQNFSAAAATFPVQTGTLANRPSSCGLGQHYFATDTTVADGARLYGCSSANAWISVGFGRGTAANRPVACTPGDIYFGTDATAGQNLFFCTTVNSWTQIPAGGGGSANPMTTLGDTIYAGVGGAQTRLSGNTTSTKQFLTQTGTGIVSAPPAWGTIAASDVTAALGYTPENRSSKGIANGYAPLDSTGRVPAANLPSSAGTVTNSAGALVSGAIVVGNGANDAKTSAVTVDSSSSVSAAGGFNSVGAGSGTMALSGMTSGTMSQTVQAASGTWTFTWPNVPAGAHQFLTTDSNGVASFSQPSAADLAPIGTIPPSTLPAPTSTTLGGVQAGDCSGAGHIVRIGTNGSVTCSADAVSAIPAHAGTHASGGSDPVTLAESQITNLTADLTGKQAALGFMPENTANKGAASGYASLDSASHLTAIQSAAITGDVTKDAGASAATVRALNGVALSGLPTGILKNTTTTGVPSIAVAGDFPTLNQNTTGMAAGLSATLAVASGGTGTASTLTGIVRGGSPMTASELSGDATTSGSNVVTVGKINGVAVTGTPSVGYVPTATSSSTAIWQAPGGGSSGGPRPNTTRWAFWNYPGSGTTVTGAIGMGLALNAGTGSASTVSSTAGPMFNVVTGATSASRGTIVTGNIFWAARNPLLQTRFKLVENSVQRSVIWISDNGEVTMLGADSPAATNYAAFRCTAGTDTNWKTMTSGGNSVQTINDSGIPCNATAHNFEININYGTNAVFKVDGATVATHTTNLPTAVALMVGVGIQTLENVAKNFQVGWVYNEVLF